MERLLRIGEFARLCRVSVKALRFYEEEGLLAPAWVDRSSGYRHYALAQADRLALIANLRAAEVSIADIRALIAVGDDRAALAEALALQRRRLEVESDAIAARLCLVDALARMAASDDPVSEAPIRLIAIAPQLAYCARARLDATGDAITRMFETGEAEIARHAARAPDAPFLFFHEADEDDGGLDVEIAIPVTRDIAPALPIVMTPGAPHACSLVYAGDYEKTFPLARRMRAWIDRAGLKAEGPLREIFHRFGADQEDYRLPPAMLARDGAEFLTELQIPIAFR